MNFDEQLVLSVLAKRIKTLFQYGLIFLDLEAKRAQHHIAKMPFSLYRNPQ